MATDYAFPYAFDLTEPQFGRLLGLVRAAHSAESARHKRMASRYKGAHYPAAIRDARDEAKALAELEAALLEGSRGNR